MEKEVIFYDSTFFSVVASIKVFADISKELSFCFPGNYSPASLIIDGLRILCDRKECATECLYTNRVIEALLQPIHYLLNEKQVCWFSSE